LCELQRFKYQFVQKKLLFWWWVLYQNYYLVLRVAKAIKVFKKRGVVITRKNKAVREQILNFIQTEEYPISTRQLTLKLSCSWHTVQQQCLELQIKGKIDRLEVTGSHLWTKKGSYTNFLEKTTPHAVVETKDVDQMNERELLKEISQEIDQELGQEISRELNQELGQKIDQEIRQELENQLGNQLERQLENQLEKETTEEKTKQFRTSTTRKEIKKGIGTEIKEASLQKWTEQ